MRRRLQPVHRRLQPHAPQAASSRIRGCNSMHLRLHLRLQPEAATRSSHAPEAAAARAAGVPRCSSPASPWRAPSETPSPCCCSAAGAPASRMASSPRPSSSSSPEPPARSRRRLRRMGPPPSTCGRGLCSSCYRAFASGSKRASRTPAAACPPLALRGGRLRSGHPQRIWRQLELPRTKSCCATGWRTSSLDGASSVRHSLEAPPPRTALLWDRAALCCRE